MVDRLRLRQMCHKSASILDDTSIKVVILADSKKLLRYVEEEDILRIPRWEYQGLEKQAVTVGLINFEAPLQRAEAAGENIELVALV